MKQVSLLALFVILLFSACINDVPSIAKAEPKKSPLTLLQEENADFQYKNLRLYPVLASAELARANAGVNNLKTLAEAMEQSGFRVLEQKQFGRKPTEWYHGITVQNKTQDTVLLLSGDVVKGGNQDRVIAHHEVILPMSVRNIEVFCVEAGRSSYYDPSASAVEKETAAFKGYYNVACPQVRQAIQNSGNQQEVWAAVAQVTKANHAESATNTYTALDNESAEKQQRDTYLNHLEGKFDARPEVVGVVAVCGAQVLSVDIFGSHELFQREYSALLHGYVAEAASNGSATPISASAVQSAFEKVSRMAAAHAQSNKDAGKFAWNGSWVHLFGK